MPPKIYSRRELLLFWRTPNQNTTAPIAPVKYQTQQPYLLKPPASNLAATRLRPPGATLDFETRCTRCGACREACPAAAIVQTSADGQTSLPFIDPKQQPCMLCEQLACTQVCPSQALQKLTLPSQIALGNAHIDAQRCAAWQNAGCRTCFEVCPLEDVISLLQHESKWKPIAGNQACSGCGLCVQHCPVDGAIRVLSDDSQANLAVYSSL